MAIRHVQWDLALIALGLALGAPAILQSSSDIGLLRPIAAVLFLYVIPGYTLVLGLFPHRQPAVPSSDGMEPAGAPKVLTGLERFALSVVASLAITPLAGLVVDRVPGGLRPASMVFALLLVDALLFIVAAVRVYQVPPEQRRLADLQVAGWGTTGKQRTATVFALLLLLAAAATVGWVVAKPQPHQDTTAVYLLGPTGQLLCFPASYNGTFHPSAIDVGLGCPETVGNVTLGVAASDVAAGGYVVHIGWMLEDLGEPGSEPQVLGFRDVDDVHVLAADFVHGQPDHREVSYTLPPPPFHGTVRLTFTLLAGNGEGDPLVAPAGLLMTAQ